MTIENQRYLFWLNTGELPETLLDITDKISRRLSLLNRRGERGQQIRGCKLNSVNKVLMILRWLRKYPYIDTLALIFDVSPSTVSDFLRTKFLDQALTSGMLYEALGLHFLTQWDVSTARPIKFTDLRWSPSGNSIVDTAITIS